MAVSIHSHVTKQDAGVIQAKLEADEKKAQAKIEANQKKAKAAREATEAKTAEAEASKKAAAEAKAAAAAARKLLAGRGNSWTKGGTTDASATAAAVEGPAEGGAPSG